jgi:hypothetical protein
MARTPAELLSRLSQADMAEVDALERAIDEDMEARYQGGEYEYDAGKKIPAVVVRELQRRYTGWFVQAIYASYRLHLTAVPFTSGDPARDTRPSNRTVSLKTA